MTGEFQAIRPPIGPVVGAEASTGPMAPVAVPVGAVSATFEPSSLPGGGGRSVGARGALPAPVLPWQRGLLLEPGPRTLLAGLWPNGIADTRMQQGYIGDCYLVAYLHALKQHPIAPYLFAWMVQPGQGSQRWNLRFLNPEVKTVPVSRWDLTWASGFGAAIRAMINPVALRGVSGQLGDRLLEKGISRYRRMAKDAVRRRPGYIAANRREDVPEGTEALAGLGGFARYIHDIIFTDAYAKYHSVGTHFMAFADSGASEQDAVMQWLERYGTDAVPYIMHASTTHRKKRLPHGLIANHAYAVTHYDLQKNEVTVVNPHDTKRGSVVLSADAFCACFDILEITELKFDALLRTLGPMHFLQHRSLVDEGGALIPHAQHRFRPVAGRTLQIAMDGHTITASVYDAGCAEWSITGLMEGARRAREMLLGPYEWMEIGREQMPDHPADVALRHLHVQVEGDGTMTLRDLGSATGTTVTVTDLAAPAPHVAIPWNKRLTPQQEYRLPLAVLNETAFLEIGDTQLEIMRNAFGQIVLHHPAGGIHIMLNEGQERILGKTDLDDNRYASHRHVRLRWQNGVLLITDLGSTNGTRLLPSAPP